MQRLPSHRLSQAGSVTGRAAGAGDRPRVRAANGSGELSVPAYEVFSSTELLGAMAEIDSLNDQAGRLAIDRFRGIGPERDRAQ